MAFKSTRKELKKILIISSRPPSHSAGLGQDIIDALIENQKEVDFLSTFEFHDPSINYIQVKSSIITQLKTKYSLIISILRYCFNIKSIAKVILGRPFYISNNEISIKYPFEDCPTVLPKNIVKSIKKEYDLIITLFWQDMLTTQSLKVLYDAIHAPILIYSPDMAPITGGCFYFNKCTGYTKECGKCPGLNSSNAQDISSRNYKIKKNNYTSINASFLGNTWMIKHAIKSKLFPSDRIFNVEIIVNDKHFKPMDKSIVRERFGIDYDKFVIMLRSTSDFRKRNKDIKKAIDLFYTRIPIEERTNVCVMTVGDNYFDSLNDIRLYDIINLGQVDRETLVMAYNASDLFLNASIDDAGPSMINQSIMCGTPVIAYKTGAALDILEDNISGFSSNIGDYEMMAENILKLYKLTDTQRNKLKESTLKTAILHNSKQTFVNKIERIWNEIQV